MTPLTPEEWGAAAGGLIAGILIRHHASRAEQAWVRAEARLVALHARRVAKAAAWDRPTPYEATTERQP